VIHQGELLHGDANGVAAIPLDIAGEVADACDEFVAAELIVIEYARGPGPKTVAEFAARRQAFSAAVAKMKERLKRK
jgi:4-hydroxy-4-methyl-2-oxoglutarate aldolase